MQVHSDIMKCFHQGLSSEDVVKTAILESCGGVVNEATLEDDKRKHVDLWWEKPDGEKVGIDVKGRHKKCRNDADYDDSAQWLELANVLGYPGWVYGEMDYVAFLTKRDVVFVSPLKLRELIDEKVDKTRLSAVNPHENYVLYQRWGRKDVIVQVPTGDIRELADFTVQLHKKEEPAVAEVC